MKYWKLPKVFVLLLVLTFFVALFFALRGASYDLHQTQSTVTELEDGWTLEYKGQTKENVNVSKEKIGIVRDQEVVRLSHVLSDTGLDNPCLYFYSIHALVNVYLDNELIYSFGGDFYKNQNSIPKKHNHVALGNAYPGKMLTIELIGMHNESFSYLPHVYVGKRSDILTKEISDCWVAILTGFFLFTLGILLIILSPYLFIYHNNDLRIFFSGLISLMLSIYIMGNFGIFDMLIDNSLLNTVLEYSALYNIPTAVVGYLMSNYRGRIQKIFLGMFIFDVFLFLSSAVLHFSHIARLSDFTIILHVAAGAESVFAIYIIIRHFIANRKDLSLHLHASENIFIIGLITFMVFSTVDIIGYNLSKYLPSASIPSSGMNSFILGALIFVTFLLLSYFFYNIHSSNMDSMQSRIMNLAYTDALTGLSNRAHCEQMLTMLSQEHGTYAIVSLDLNWLKKVNDALGHHEGDRLLTGFATILSDCFWDANLIGRMGGDEFIVVLLEDRSFNVTKRLHELYSTINDWNNKEQRFKYSAAYGYAYSYEVPNGSAKEVYMLADNRMYEMKREQHDHESKEVIAHA